MKTSTVEFYRSNLDRYVLPLLGDRPLAEITRPDGRELIAACRQKGLRLNTVKRNVQSDPGRSGRVARSSGVALWQHVGRRPPLYRPPGSRTNADS